MSESDKGFSMDVAVIGGGGHVGLPLAITFADCGLETLIYDVNEAGVEKIRQGLMPFTEDDAPEMLRSAIDSGKLHADSKPNRLADCKYVVCIVGTPVDEHLNPSFAAIHRALETCREFLRDGQVFILRSTVFPGTTNLIRRYFQEQNLNIRISFCPERVAQGKSLKEFRTLPQIISGYDEQTLEDIRWLFGHFAPEFVEMSPGEAELCKLMTNAWRYLEFAAANQFYMIATKNGHDFDRILHGCRHNYPRMGNLPGPGLAAGPCLLKDTLQLAAFSENNFMLGHSAMLVNEGLPAHLIQMAAQQTDLSQATIGILGLAFKGESDDPRDSLSYKLKKLAMLESPRVLVTDPYVPDANKVLLDEVLEKADVLFLATPHKIYRDIKIPADRIVIDVWNCLPARS